MPRNAASAVALALTAAVAASAARSVGHGRHSSFLSLRSDLQPQAVALTLARVEQDWREEAAVFARCSLAPQNGSAGCAPSGGRFEASCAKIISAVVQASTGDRKVVKEYLDEVCIQQGLEGWRAEACRGLATALVAAMSPSPYVNREGVNAAKPCQSFWKGFTASELERAKKDQAEEQAEEKRRAEAAEKVQKAAQEAAEAEAEEQQKSQAEAAALQSAEAERKAQEAARQAERQHMLNITSAVDASAEDQERLVGQELAEAQADLDAAARPPPAIPAPAAANTTTATSGVANISQAVDRNSTHEA